MKERILYEEGKVENPYIFLFRLETAGLFGINASGMARYIEFWCQENCIGKWKIIETEEFIKVLFDNDQDFIMFHLSDEYSRFSYSNSIVINSDIYY